MDHARAARRRQARRGALRRLERRRDARRRLDLSVRRAAIATSSAFRADIELKARSDDPLFFAVVDNATGRAVGYQTLMRIDPANRVIEVGNVMYTPAMQRTPAATEAQYLFARLCVRRPRQSPLRMEVQQPQRALEARGDALWLLLRGRFSPAHDRQGPQSRHRLVCDARQRMAGAQGGLRTLACAGQFRRRGPPEDSPFRPHAEGPTR